MLPCELQHGTWKTSSPSEALPPPTSCFSACFLRDPSPHCLPTCHSESQRRSWRSSLTTTKANRSAAAAAFAIFHCKVDDFGNCGPKIRCLVLLWVFLLYFLFSSLPLEPLLSRDGRQLVIAVIPVPCQSEGHWRGVAAP